MTENFMSEWQSDLERVISSLVNVNTMSNNTAHTVNNALVLNQVIDQLERLRDRLDAKFTCPFCGNTFVPPSVDDMLGLTEAYLDQQRKAWSTDCTLYHMHKMLSVHFKDEDSLASARQAVEKKEQF